METPPVNGGEVGGERMTRKVLGKRPASHDSIGDQERFHKRFNLLSLGGVDNTNAHTNSNYYIPVSGSRNTAALQEQARHAVPSEINVQPNDLMHVENTRDRVFIHNLDEELADVESEEERLIFLPDIEKHFSRIPRHVLTERKDDEPRHQELVLYSVPKLLTAQDNGDSVRRAIIEARHRAQEKAAEDARHDDMTRRYESTDPNGSIETAHGYTSGYTDEIESQNDGDGMDID
nr:hypothetical protein CFP56_50369 [Quercus suber]